MSQAKDNYDEAKSGSVEIRAIGDAKAEATSSPGTEQVEEQENAVHDDSAHMARLGKKQQFDVCSSFETESAIGAEHWTSGISSSFQ